ncbi:hypothetical protein JVW25_20240, partial [Vibrio cholerae O1]|nr:hypothetical protein [Vibrio cholerae O1]
VIIEDDVLIGANAVILEGVRVGKGAIVAAGAIVTQDVPAGAVVAGTPAKVIKQASEVQDTKKEIVAALSKLNGYCRQRIIISRLRYDYVSTLLFIIE